MPDFLLGMNAKIYQGAAAADPATLDPATLTEMGNVKDVTLSLEAGEADITTRANSGWRATAPTLRECSCEFEMVWKPGDVGFEAIKSAFLSAGTVALAVLTGAHNESGAEGPVGNWSITNFSRSEALEEAVTVSVTAKLAAFGQWFEAA
ncbi:MAG TPA: phage tail tube protein [Anaerohalosphaeraceae bacterium]|nr:phage tail tube protein [Anaerohalosphaeraceae bacterium]HOL31308.1 phage tail tube protein [Anaerohalosphaeraceae bacterium]HRV20834.1 phage tail tube protein [Anaerohalosphaeraceae bacterium]